MRRTLSVGPWTDTTFSIVMWLHRQSSREQTHEKANERTRKKQFSERKAAQKGNFVWKISSTFYVPLINISGNLLYDLQAAWKHGDLNSICLLYIYHHIHLIRHQHLWSLDIASICVWNSPRNIFYLQKGRNYKIKPFSFTVICSLHAFFIPLI